MHENVKHSRPWISTKWGSRQREPVVKGGPRCWVAELGTLIHKWKEEEGATGRTSSHWQLHSFWEWNNPPASKGLFWEAVEGAASKSWGAYLGPGLLNGDFVLYPGNSACLCFWAEERKMKVAFLERFTGSEKKKRNDLERTQTGSRKLLRDF